MPYRTTPLVIGEYYHIYNRGVAHQPTFSSNRDYERFITYLRYYRFENVPFRLSKFLQLSQEDKNKWLNELELKKITTVEIIAFCLMPNHFHLLLKQTSNNGISLFMKKVTDGYTRYFNTRHERVGPVFQGAFKAIHVSNTEQLLHLSRYIHLNPLVSFVVREEDFINYPWSSLQSYIKDNSSFVRNEMVLNYFKSKAKYLNFVMDQADYGKQLEMIKHLALE